MNADKAIKRLKYERYEFVIYKSKRLILINSFILLVVSNHSNEFKLQKAQVLKPPFPTPRETKWESKLQSQKQTLLRRHLT